MHDWSEFLSAMTLVMVRLSGVVAFAPFFSSTALPLRAKGVFVLVVSYLLAPLVVTLPRAAHGITFSALLSEVAVGLIYGLCLTLLNEMLLYAGQIIGLQFSFSLVNLLDPASSIQTPLMGELFQLMGTLVVLAAGLDRTLIASVVRSFRAIPLGGFEMAPTAPEMLVRAASGIFLASVELAAPVLAATLMVEVAIALMSKLSPQLPVMALTVPMKTMTGFLLLMGSLALWPRFIEARFASLLDLAGRLLGSYPQVAQLGGH